MLLLKLLLLAVLVVLLVHQLRNWVKVNLFKEPPIVSGLFPFVGCMYDLAREKPALFIKKCQEKHGDIFTWEVGGRNLTFIMNPVLYDIFFCSKETDVDFLHATQPFLSRGFGVSKEMYFNHHTIALTAMRGFLSPHSLKHGNHLPVLYEKLSKHLEDNWNSPETNESTINLYAAIQRAIFWCSVPLLFGEQIVDFHDLLDHFSSFDNSFELATANVPHILLRSFSRGKAYLLQALNHVAKTRNFQSQETAIVNFLLQRVPDSNQKSWLLSILWASQSNTIPTIFWLLTYILSNPPFLNQLRAEIDEFMQSGDSKIGFDELSKLKLVKQAVQETLRLRSAPLIVRKTQNPVKAGPYTIPPGNFLCLSPLWSHRREDSFTDASTWNPARWSEVSKAFGSWHGRIEFRMKKPIRDSIS